MRLSELASKRIINLYNGEIIGTAGDSDLMIDPASGLITEIVGAGRTQPWSRKRRNVHSLVSNS